MSKSIPNVLGCLVLTVLLVPAARAQSDDEARPAAAGEDTGYELHQRQELIAGKYADLERLMFRMAELEAASNPTRSKLLKRAIAQSKQRLTLTQFNALVRQLEATSSPSKQVIDGQTAVKGDLDALLELLLSESRSDRIRDEQTKIREFIKEVERIMRLERGLRSRAEGGDDAQRLATEQGKVANRTDKLAKDIRETEAGGGDGSGDSEGDSQGGSEGDSKGDSEGDSKGDSEGDSKGDSEGDSKGDSKGDSEGDSKGDSEGDSKGDSKGDSEGDSKGDSEGDSKGDSEGDSKGDSEGDSEGDSKGDSEGDSKGDSEGDSKGDSKGDSEGDSKGDSEGDSEGDSKGDSEGDSKGDSEGDSEGDSKGDSEGDSKGDSEGDSKGDSEGDSKGDSEGDSKGDSEGDSKGDSQGDSKGDSQGDSKGDSQGDSQGGAQQPSSSDENPARKRIEAAEQKMREAQQRLEEARRAEAVEAQEKALEELKQAKAELEEILRQLREEELERTLALLEGRFRRMLEQQVRIYETTIALDKIPVEQRNRQVDIRVGQLSFDEKKLVIEADRAYTLLLEEGSSIAFPETIDLMREDMAQVTNRLADIKIGRITQGLEEEIIRTLEEVIEALQQAQRDLEEQRNNPPPSGQPGEPQDQPLIDQIAELRMIRALQLRVNTRTSRYARYLDDENDPVGQALDEDLRTSIARLSEREQRIQRITHDIVLGKNK